MCVCVYTGRLALKVRLWPTTNREIRQILAYISHTHTRTHIAFSRFRSRKGRGGMATDKSAQDPVALFKAHFYDNVERT